MGPRQVESLFARVEIAALHTLCSLLSRNEVQCAQSGPERAALWQFDPAWKVLCKPGHVGLCEAHFETDQRVDNFATMSFRGRGGGRGECFRGAIGPQRCCISPAASSADSELDLKSKSCVFRSSWCFCRLTDRRTLQVEVEVDEAGGVGEAVEEDSMLGRRTQ